MKKILVLLSTMVALSGCIHGHKHNDPDPVTPVTQEETQIVSNTCVVVVGVENGYAGKCGGSLLDAENMSRILGSYAAKSVVLTDSNATYVDVYTNLVEAVKYDLCIFYYSGHGGSTAATSDTSEVDGNDEYLCLFDRGMLDNDIWDITGKARGRVVLLFDACHSATMYRSIFNFRRKAVTPRATVKGVSILCMSGCPDTSYSYGSSEGGMFTNTLLKHFDPSKTYDELWDAIEKDETLKKYEAVQRTKIGEDFGSLPVFQ